MIGNLAIVQPKHHSKLVDSNADYVEVGFLRNCSYDKNATLFNNIAELKKILPREQKIQNSR